MPSPLSPMKSDEPLIALVGKFSMEPAYCEKKRKEQRERCKNDENMQNKNDGVKMI